jgi:hypothetical protein
MAPVEIRVTTDAETFARVRENGKMVDDLVDTFQELFQTRVTAKCKFKQDTPYVLLRILDLTKEVLPLLWSFKEGGPVPLVIQNDMYTLRLV